MKFKIFAHEILVRSFVAVMIVIGLITGMPSAQSGETKTIVIFGDSLVAGYGLAPAEAFPSQLGVLLKEKGLDVEVVNAGVSGDTTTGGFARLDWSIGEGVDAVVVELGANDALRGIPPSVTAKNLEAIVVNLKQRGIRVLLAGMKAPPNMGVDYVDEFDRIYPELAQKHELEFYPFFLDGVAAIARLNQDDGIHPTAEGVAIIAERFLPSAISLLQRITNK